MIQGFAHRFAQPRFLGLATISDSFVFLILQQQMGIPVTAFPLLYVGTSLSTAVFAARSADSQIGSGGCPASLEVIWFSR